MPKIEFKGNVINCESGANLRKVLLKSSINIHNGASEWLNCRGLGTCGTCSVVIEEECDQSRNKKEKVRLCAPPFFNTPKNVRLACQYAVKKDIKIKKGKGFWGEKV